MADIDKIKRNINKMIDMGAPEKDIDNYITSEGITIDMLKNKSLENKKDLTWGQVGKQAISNVPGSAVEFGTNIIQPIIHPIETGKGLYTIAKGGVSKLTEGEQPEEQAWDAVGRFFKDRYGGIENLKTTIANDPVGFMADLSTILTGVGGLAKGVGKVGQLSKVTKVGEVVSKIGTYTDPLTLSAKAMKPIIKPVLKQGAELGKEIFGKTTGAGREAIEQSIKGGKTFRTAMRGGIEQTEVLEQAKDALTAVKSDRALAYTSKLDDIKTISKTLDVTPIKNKMDVLLKSYNIKKEIDNTGKLVLDFSRSTIDRNAVSDVTQIINMLEDWGSQADDLTPKGLDILKRRLDDFYSESKNSRAMIAQLRDTTKTVLTKEVPGYAEMTKEYAQTTQFINEIERALSLGKRSMADTALKKLMSTMRENFEFRKQLVQKLETLGKESNISEKIAGVTMRPLIPRGLLGPLGASGIVLTGLVVDPKLFGILLLSSPRLVGEFVNFLSRTSRELQKVGKIIRPTRKISFQAGRAIQQIGVEE